MRRVGPRWALQRAELHCPAGEVSPAFRPALLEVPKVVRILAAYSEALHSSLKNEPQIFSGGNGVPPAVARLYPTRTRRYRFLAQCHDQSTPNGVKPSGRENYPTMSDERAHAHSNLFQALPNASSSDAVTDTTGFNKLACLVTRAHPDLPVASKTCRSGETDIRHTREHLKKVHQCNYGRGNGPRCSTPCQNPSHLSAEQLGAVTSLSKKQHESPGHHWLKMYNRLPSASSQIPPDPAPYLPSADQLLAVATYPTPEFQLGLAARFREEGLDMEDGTGQVKQFLSQFLIFHDLVSRQGTLPLSSPQTPAHQSVPTNPSKPPDPGVRDCINVSPLPTMGSLLTPSSSGGTVPEVMYQDEGPDQHSDSAGDHDDGNWREYLNFLGDGCH